MKKKRWVREAAALRKTRNRDCIRFGFARMPWINLSGRILWALNPNHMPPGPIYRHYV
jgi:hypothetical protein